VMVAGVNRYLLSVLMTTVWTPPGTAATVVVPVCGSRLIGDSDWQPASSTATASRPASGRAAGPELRQRRAEGRRD
jgi:hypothetical protein